LPQHRRDELCRELERVGTDSGSRRRARSRSRASARSIRREGGNTARHQVFVLYRLRPIGKRASCGRMAYAGTYRFNLYSDFTLYLDDPSQWRRDRAGRPPDVLRRQAELSRGASSFTASSLRHDPRRGRSASDDIHLELWHTAERKRLDARFASADVHESIDRCLCINEEISPAKLAASSIWARRADLLSSPYACSSSDAMGPGSGVGAGSSTEPEGQPGRNADRLRPRPSLTCTGTTGTGTTRTMCVAPLRSIAVSPLVRAVGEEVGSRAASVGALGSGGGFVAARSRQRDCVEWRRRHDRRLAARPPAGASSWKAVTS
jgi:hypothetical protein